MKDNIVNSFQEIFKKSLDTQLLLNFFFLFLISIVAMLGGLVLGALLCFPLALIGIAVFSALQLQPIATTIYMLLILIAIIIFFVLMYLVDTLIFGLQLFLIRSYEKTKKVDFTKIFEQTKKNLTNATLAKILITLVITLFLALIFVTTLFFTATNLQNITQLEDLSKLGIGILILLIIILILSILLAPYFVILVQIFFFENTKIQQGLQKTFELGSKNFLKNLAYAIIFMLIIILIGGIINIPIGLLEMLAGESDILQLALAIFTVPIQIALNVWAFTFASLFFVKIYDINTQKHSIARKTTKKKR